MLSNVRLILMRPRNSENLGAAARAMKNFGLCNWAWVEPHAQDDENARKLAVNSEDVLSLAARPVSLADAVSDCSWVVGTSSRRVKGKRSLTPKAWAEEAMRRGGSEERMALVFGDERCGLRAEDVHACHDLATIPTDDTQPSVNLAQAILLFSYELWSASLARQPTELAPRAAPATDQALRELQEELHSALTARSFVVDGGRHATRDLFDCLRRARLTRKEADLWRSALRVLGHGRRRVHESP